METLSFIANFGIYDFSLYAVAVVRSRISHATRIGVRLDLDGSRKIREKKEEESPRRRAGVNFDRLNIAVSKWKRGRLRDTISCRVSCHSSLLFRLLVVFFHPSSLLPLPFSRLFFSHRMKFRKFAAPFHRPRREEKRFENGSCSCSTEVALAKLRYKKVNKFLTASALFARDVLFLATVIRLFARRTGEARRRDKRENVYLGR